MKKQTEPDIVNEWNGIDGATTIDSVDKEQLRELARILGRIAARRDLAQAHKDRAVSAQRTSTTGVHNASDDVMSIAPGSPAE